MYQALLGRGDDMITIRGVNVYPTTIENAIRQFPSVDKFQATVTRVNEMHDLEIQIEVVSGGEVEAVRTQVEHAIYHAISLRPKVWRKRVGVELKSDSIKPVNLRRCSPHAPANRYK